MQCLRPRKFSFDSKGEQTFRQSEMMPGLVATKIPCGKCLPCRLNHAQEKAIRAVHEAKMHKENIFLTLTYNEESLLSPRLQYSDFQTFMDSLRKKITRGITDSDLKKKLRISYMVTGEYGELNKRPHWHAILFNFSAPDARPKYKTEQGEQVFESEILTNLWGKGMVEYGSVTMDSAGYVARYSAKKLVHGYDQEHDFHPIHKTSSARAIGKSWIELYWKHTFDNGFIILPNGTPFKIPRYYNDWFKKNHPELWTHYVTQVKPKAEAIAEARERKEELEYLSELWSKPHGFPNPITRSKVKETILNSKFKQLQERLKL